MTKNSNLVDFERGSIFGGLLTAFVFVGFVSLLVYDLSDNVSNKPYTLKVEDRVMTAEEHQATRVNFGDFE